MLGEKRELIPQERVGTAMAKLAMTTAGVDASQTAGGDPRQDTPGATRTVGARALEAPRVRLH